MEGSEHLVRISGLNISAPDGNPVLIDAAFTLNPGQIAVLLGGSGAGKSTFLRAIEDPKALKRDGFKVSFDSHEVKVPLGKVPQRGALFDHLSVKGNVELARRYAEQKSVSPEDWMERFHLPREWGREKQGTAYLSGGEAQRVAVARTLAGGRRLLFLDEPSVGIDPYRVFLLADILREQIADRKAAAVVVTHDLSFAAAVHDQLWFLNRRTARLEQLKLEECLADRNRSIEETTRIQSALQCRVVEELRQDAAQVGKRRQRAFGSRLKSLVLGTFAPFSVPVEAMSGLLMTIVRPRGGFGEVFKVVLKQSLLRPFLFFAVVSTLIGYSLLHVLDLSFRQGDLALRAEAMYELIRSKHIIALTPALGSILFSATAANSVTAWIGGLKLTRQSEALAALGIPESRYVRLPAWFGLFLSSLVLLGTFGLGMTLGTTIHMVGTGMTGDSAWEFATADFVDPFGTGPRLLARAALLACLYSAGVAADAVAKGSTEKRTSESVTRSMISSVMVSTLWIVSLELITLPLIYEQ